jgi:hypothetical protein
MTARIAGFDLARRFWVLFVFTVCLPSYGVPINLIQNGDFRAGLNNWTLSGNGGYGMAFEGGSDGGAYVFLDSLSLSPLSQNMNGGKPQLTGLNHSQSAKEVNNHGV